MAFFVAILPLLQGISALCTIWGFMHVAPATETVVSYGVNLYGDSGTDGATAGALLNSFGSIAVGLVGMLATWYAKSKTGAKSEIMVALIGYLTKPTDPTNWRRLLLAILDLIEEKYGNSTDANEAAAFKYVSDYIIGKATTAKTDPAVIKV